jgi:hypothetical protein
MFLRKQRQRIRTRSVLLASYRRGNQEWGRWLQWEIAKPAVPLVLLTALHMLEWIAIPHALFLLMLLAYAIWMAFLSWNAWSALRRLDRKRLALLEASGVQCGLDTVMTDRRAWAAVRDGKTMREILDSPPLD